MLSQFYGLCGFNIILGTLISNKIFYGTLILNDTYKEEQLSLIIVLIKPILY